MKPRLLYLASSGLGENIFATHALEFLAETYEIHFVVREDRALFFKNYEFITQVIGVTNNFSSLDSVECCNYLRQLIDVKDYSCYYSHNLYVMDKIKDLGIERRAHASEKPKKLSSAEQYLLRVGGNPDLIDSRYKPAAPVKRDGARKIVLYMGSRELLRKLPVVAYNTILEKLHLKYANQYQIYCIYASPATQAILAHGTHILDVAQNSQKILDLFSSGVDLMVGPDSGLTHVALSFNIPQIWMETRDRVEMAIPYSYKDIVDVFRVSRPICAQHCKAMTHIKIHGVDRLDYCPYIKEAVSYQELPCARKDISPCLIFKDEDYEELFKKIANRLSVNKD